MFVRWKDRHRPNGSKLLCAMLVESVRTEKGPRQRVLQYLASVDQSSAQVQDDWSWQKVRNSMLDRIYFWANFETALIDQGLSDEKILALIEKAAARVDRPSLKDVKLYWPDILYDFEHARPLFTSMSGRAKR